MRRDIQMRAVPENIGTRCAAIVELRTGIGPRLRRNVELVDVERRSSRAPHIGPPGPVIPPKLALWLRATWRLAGPCKRLVLVTRRPNDCRLPRHRRRGPCAIRGAYCDADRVPHIGGDEGVGQRGRAADVRTVRSQRVTAAPLISVARRAATPRPARCSKS